MLGQLSKITPACVVGGPCAQPQRLENVAHSQSILLSEHFDWNLKLGLGLLLLYYWLIVAWPLVLYTFSL